MKPATDEDIFLSDVLAEAAPAGFEADLRNQVLGLAARRRRLRIMRRATVGVVAAATVLLAALFLRLRGHVATITTTVASPELIVETRPGVCPIVRTTSWSDVAIVHTTLTSGHFRQLDDRELLALLIHHPAALVRLNRTTERLIFVNADDARGFRTD